MKLIINADDFGLTKGVTLGILKAMEEGVVTETTALANGEYFREGIEEAKLRGIRNIGVHLTITGGKSLLPLEQVPSLVDERGYFRKSQRNYNYAEIKEELRAQMEGFLQVFDEPSHIDGHHHFYGFNLELMEIVFELAKEYKLPLRLVDNRYKKLYAQENIATTEAFSTAFYGKKLSFQCLKDTVMKHRNYDTLEIMTHPAYVDERLMLLSSYNLERARELEIITSEELKAFIKHEGIELMTYRDII